MLRCFGKSSKLTRIGHENENNKKKLKQSKQAVKKVKSAVIKKDKLSIRSSSQLPSLPVGNHVYPQGSTAFVNKKNIPCYKVVKKEGPDHAPTFTVEVNLGGRKAYGSGASLKKAKVQSLSNLKK